MASITITVPDAEVPRVAAAIGDQMGLRDSNGVARSATGPEMRAWVVERVKRLTFAYEDAIAQAQRPVVTEVGAA